jgi:hypothetical protein
MFKDLTRVNIRGRSDVDLAKTDVESPDKGVFEDREKRLVLLDLAEIAVVPLGRTDPERPEQSRQHPQ